jgi:hypothetical protein
MAMWIEVTMSDGASVYVRASGDYAPDVMHDLQNRAAALMNHAASIGLQVLKAVNDMDIEPAKLDEPAEDEDVAG